jgi:hypothetical protein
LSEATYRLEVAAFDLGPDVKSEGLELIDPETREPVTGAEAAKIWAAVLISLAADKPWVLDFFAHLERVREFCKSRNIAFREPGERVVTVPQQPAETLAAIVERFAGETFGVRAGEPAASGDGDVEAGLALRGVDGYHTTYARYLFCAVCDFENGFLTLLSNPLWASEVIRRSKTALPGLPVEIARPG